jgi:hypothetical protein
MSATNTIERWAVQVHDEGVWRFLRKGSYDSYSVVNHPSQGTTYTKKLMAKRWVNKQKSLLRYKDTAVLPGLARSCPDYRIVKVKFEYTITEIVEDVSDDGAKPDSKEL